MTSSLKSPTMPSVSALPDYLGLGTLDPASVQSTGDTLSARYACEGETIYDLKWQPARCLVHSYCAGKLIGISFGHDLQMAFYQDILAWLNRDDDDPRVAWLVKRIFAVGRNVYFMFPKGAESRFAFYPGGLIFQLRQPITDENRAAWASLRRRLAATDAEGLLHVAYDGPGEIVRLHDDGTTSSEQIGVVDLHSVMINLVETVRLLRESGLGLAGKEYRLSVSLPFDRLICHGDAARGFKAFSVTISGKPFASLGS